FKPRASRPPISKPDELKETLAKLRGHRVRLWDYLISHSVLQLRVAHFAHHGYSSKRNTLIVCTLAKHINVPTETWDSNLALDIGEDESGKVYRLIDEAAKVLIQSRYLVIYENMPAHFFGV